MKKILLGVAMLVLLGGGYYWYASQTPINNEVTNQEETTSQGKLNINVVCEGALAYMSFPDGASADKFVAECKAGDHPEVIERYKADQHYNDDAAI